MNNIIHEYLEDLQGTCLITEAKFKETEDRAKKILKHGLAYFQFMWASSIGTYMYKQLTDKCNKDCERQEIFDVCKLRCYGDACNQIVDTYKKQSGEINKIPKTAQKSASKKLKKLIDKWEKRRNKFHDRSRELQVKINNPETAKKI